VAPQTTDRSFRPLAEEVKELERRRITEALDATDGNQKRAADLLGVPLRTFYFKMKAFGLSRRRRREPES
jgi:DNA-binding NtrC family response regulator